MPGPGGGGWGGGERGGPGGGGPGGGGFRGPGAPANPGLFFGGPGLGPEFGRHGGGRPGGPMGTSCCCWALLCTIAFVVLLSAGVALIETADECSGDSSSIGRDDDGTDLSTCYGYMAALAVGLGMLALCCCCCCMRPSEGDGYQPVDGSVSERQHMLATEAHPTRVAYGN
ncbi:unnamed protein product [Pylaiella littoralis]